jgi:uroporphyrinogen decarboxylase
MGEDIAYLTEKIIQEAGCLGVFLALQGAESGMFTPEEYLDIVAPSDRLVVDTAADCSAYNILHYCGWNGIKNQLELWKDYRGNTVNWAIYVEELSLPEGRRYFGMKNCLGGFDNRRTELLYRGTRDQIEAETIRIVEQYQEAFGSCEHLMLGADCSFLTDFETERFRWVTQALQKWEKGRENCD